MVLGHTDLWLPQLQSINKNSIWIKQTKKKQNKKKQKKKQKKKKKNTTTQILVCDLHSLDNSNIST